MFPHYDTHSQRLNSISCLMTRHVLPRRDRYFFRFLYFALVCLVTFPGLEASFNGFHIIWSILENHNSMLIVLQPKSHNHSPGAWNHLDTTLDRLPSIFMNFLFRNSAWCSAVRKPDRALYRVRDLRENAFAHRFKDDAIIQIGRAHV